MSVWSLVTLLVVFTISVVLSFIFSGGETSITASDIAKLNKFKMDGMKNAALVINLKERREHVIGSILLGNNLANVLSSSMGTLIAIELFGSIGIIISTFFVTAVVLVFAEMIPKTYAIKHPERTAMTFSKLINFFVTAFSPLVKSISLVVNLLLRIFDRSTPEDIASTHDIIRDLLLMRKEGESKISIQKSLDVISGILDIAEMHLDKIMTHKKDILSINRNLDDMDIIRLAVAHEYRHIPLWEGSSDNYVAVLDNDRLVSDMKRCTKLVLDDYIEKPVFIPDTTLLSVQLYNFKVNKNNFAVVVDEYGDLQGVVTLSDIFEQIVCESDAKDIEELSSYRYIVSGKATVRSVNDRLGANFPTQYNKTFSGMVIDEMGRIPEEGEYVEFFDCRLRILKKKGNVILSIEVSNSSPEESRE